MAHHGRVGNAMIFAVGSTADRAFGIGADIGDPLARRCMGLALLGCNHFLCAAAERCEMSVRSVTIDPPMWEPRCLPLGLTQSAMPSTESSRTAWARSAGTADDAAAGLVRRSGRLAGLSVLGRCCAVRSQGAQASSGMGPAERHGRSAGMAAQRLRNVGFQVRVTHEVVTSGPDGDGLACES